MQCSLTLRTSVKPNANRSLERSQHDEGLAEGLANVLRSDETDVFVERDILALINDLSDGDVLNVMQAAVEYHGNLYERLLAAYQQVTYPRSS